MEWRSEAAQDRSRVLRCFAAADRASSATLTAQFENDTWQKASSWDGYCATLAREAASLGHESCLRVLHELGSDAAASLAAADANGGTPAHYAALQGHEGCLRVLHELGGDATASLAAADASARTPAHYAAEKGHNA